jgi:bacterioferritin (cytochrome b1)
MQSMNSVLNDVNFDLITVLQSKLEAVAVYDAYLDDCDEAGDAQVRDLFERLRDDDNRHADMLRQELERIVREGKFH